MGIFVVLLVLSGCAPRDENVVVLYTSQDQVYVEPVIQLFEARTGIRVLPVFDSEAVKAVGIANRLLLEKPNPRCDVFWNNEELRTRQLEAKGVFDESIPIERTGFRTRRIVINTNLISASEAPRTFAEFADPKWKGRFVMAYPQFGSTATHVHVLREIWGEERWSEWCRAVAENDPMMVDGNSVVMRIVGAGEAAVGMTDWDDIEAGKREGLPIAGMPVSEDSLMLFNTVAIVDGAPHPENARVLWEFLSGSEAAALLEGRAFEGVMPTGPLMPLEPGVWSRVVASLESVNDVLSEVFLR